MKDLADKYFVLVDKLILIAAFWSAIIVALVTFTREAWVSNNMTEKSRNAILWIVGVVDAISVYLRQELTNEAMNDD